MGIGGSALCSRLVRAFVQLLARFVRRCRALLCRLDCKIFSADLFFDCLTDNLYVIYQTDVVMPLVPARFFEVDLDPCLGRRLPPVRKSDANPPSSSQYTKR